MARTATMTIADGVLVAVPDSLDSLTSYVLAEQHDWFEDEIGFVRKLLQAGEQVIDIGANYGVYTLSMAKAVGPCGAVWAFEPAASTAEYLKQGIAANRFAHVTLETSALSSAVGSARLAIAEQAEGNSLEHDAHGAQRAETVQVVTMDDAMSRYGWTNIDFLKMDAEGEEKRIIEGGRAFLSRCSPLILYEINGGGAVHLDLVNEFAAAGYQSYRLIPGLGLLAPFEVGESSDPFLLNLFCCKPDRAKALAERGLLSLPDAVSSAPADPNALRSHDGGKAGWEALETLPYGALLSATWRSSPRAAHRKEVDRAIAGYLSSQDDELSAAERLQALQTAFQLLMRVCTEDPSHLREVSLARVAAEFGMRSVTIEAINRLARIYARRQSPDTSEPFLAVSKRFDGVAPRDIGSWLEASLAETLEKVSSFSSFYTGTSVLPRLEAIMRFGYASDEMRRRLELVRARAGR